MAERELEKPKDEGPKQCPACLGLKVIDIGEGDKRGQVTWRQVDCLQCLGSGVKL